MLDEFGPWATSIDAGSRPQLSAFWRRRLTMLVPTSQSSPALSRRNRLWLAAATILIFAVPTFRPVLVAAEKPADKTPAKGTTFSGNISIERDTVTGAVTLNDPIGLPYPFSSSLNRREDRAKLHITQAQENKLREISKESTKRLQAIHEQMQKLSPEEQKAKQSEFAVKRAQVHKETRKQIEAALTPQQWAEIKIVCIGTPAAAQLASDAELRKAAGVTEEQLKELKQVVNKVRENQKKTDQALQETMVVVLPQQWEQAKPAEDFGDSGIGLLIGWAYGNRFAIGPQWKEKMALSDQQRAKIKEIHTASEARIRELSKLFHEVKAAKSKEEAKAKQAGFDRKMQAAWKERREQAMALLSPQQSAVLAQAMLRLLFIGQMAQFDDWAGSDDNKPEGVFEQLKLSAEQMKELRRRYHEIGRVSEQSTRAAGQAAIQILSPEQLEKVCDKWDNTTFFTGTTVSLRRRPARK